MTSRQEKIRLDMAIRIFCHQTDEDPGHQAACRSYLEKRYRVAAKNLVETGDVAGLRSLLKEGWLSERDIEELLSVAVCNDQTDCVGLFLVTVDRQEKMDAGHGRIETESVGIKPTETKTTVTKPAGIHPEETGLSRTERIEKRILLYMGRELDRRFPYLGRTMHLLNVDMDSPVHFCGTDGFILFVERQVLPAEFHRDSEGCLRRIAHSLVHAVSGHPLRAGLSGEHALWELCCDCMAEWILEKELSWQQEISVEKRRSREALYGWLKSQPKRTENVLYEYLEKMDVEQVTALADAFRVDDHRKWYEKQYSAAQWKKQLSRLTRQGSGGGQGGKTGGISGGSRQGEQSYTEPEASEYDYRRFLESFMVIREERQLDLSSFDLMFYTYSRQHYEHAVFLEPVETSEVKRLQELVIAIDTSGSCSGEIVQQFLRETFSILEKKEHFFRRMRVHILQCDSMIQDYRLIESEEDWKDYQKHLKISGFGNTDFRPVFDWIEQKKQEGVVRDIKGLLYFTDGDGIYPRSAPAYATAFVYLNDRLNKGKAPEWVRTLNLHLDREFENLFDMERDGRL